MILDFSGAPVAVAPLDRVWRCLLDPEFVARTTPGLQSIEDLGQDRHRVHARIGAGFFAADVTMDVAVSDQVPPTSATMTAQGTVLGQPVTLTSRVRLEAETPARTRIVWQGRAELGGALGGVGGTMIKAIAPKLVEQFWTDFATRVAAAA